MSCFTTFGCIEFLSLICFDILKASRNFGVFCSFLSVRKPVVEESDHVWFTSLTISELAKMNNKWWEMFKQVPCPKCASKTFRSEKFRKHQDRIFFSNFLDWWHITLQPYSRCIPLQVLFENISNLCNS